MGGAIITLAMLPSNELWTMESRWATVCRLMIYKKDYFHPYLFNGPYLDKPLFSYWLIIIFAKLFGSLNEWALRLPSALAGIGSIYCTYHLGKKLFNHSIGIIAGWLLATNYFFIFWARTASADMLNVAGILLALTWYFEHREQSRFTDYLIFFLITAITSLCKGLMGFAIPLIGVLIDLILSRKWQKHVNWKSIAACVISLLIYAVPFILTMLTNNHHQTHLFIASNGLYEVFRENIQRYITPFDHKDPFYIYFISLPIYLLPWTVLLFFAVKPYVTQWKKQNYLQHWLALFSLAIFAFFTFSGSRRGYYILPLVPFVTILVANWLYNHLSYEGKTSECQHYKIFKITLTIFYTLLFSWFVIVRPFVTSTKMQQLADKLNTAVSSSAALKNTKILVLNSNDHSLIFYLHNSQSVGTINDEKLRDTLKQRSTNKYHHDYQQPLIIVATRKELPWLQDWFNKNNEPYEILTTSSTVPPTHNLTTESKIHYCHPNQKHHGEIN